MKIAIYTRISKDEQTLDTQIQECREFCKNRGYEIVREFSDVISGTKESRPQLDLLMKASFKKEFDAVVVWKLDRLGRTLKHLVSIVNQWAVYGIDFICVTQSFDTHTPNGKLLFHLFAAIAEFERDLISERTKMGLKKAKNVGKRGKDKKPRTRRGYFGRRK
jgi:DNA invertase Pin-like site-specific DNA recombinase